MNPTRKDAIAILLAGVVCKPAFAANSVVILKGTDVDSDPFTVTLTISNNKWTKVEPNGANKVFKTAGGVWMRADNIVTLFKNDATTRVGQFKPLVPETAQQGQHGNGDEFETASSLSWTVDTVVP